MKSFDSYVSDNRNSSSGVEATFLEELFQQEHSKSNEQKACEEIALWLGLSVVATVASSRLTRLFGNRGVMTPALRRTESAKSAVAAEECLFSLGKNNCPSARFFHTVSAAYEDLPPSLRKFVESHNVKINVVETMADLGKASNAAGLYVSTDSQIYIAERFLHNGIWTTWPEYVPHTLRHEIGHAVDHLSKAGSSWVTQDVRFIAAHRSDVNLLLDAEKRSFARFSGLDELSRKEAFAELFAYAHGPGVDFHTQELFVNSFSRMMKLVRDVKF